MTKLTDKKVKWLVKQVVHNGRLPREVVTVYNLSVRRVQQLAKKYRDTGKMPVLSKDRRPKTFLSSREKELVDRVFEETKLSARLLYYELKARNQLVPKNKLYEYLKATGRVVPNPKKQKQRKRCRYERKHSGSLIHGDWHRTTENHPHCILWLDDASRKILSGWEGPRQSGKMSIKSFDKALAHAKTHNIIVKQANTDRGSEFHANKGGKSKFRQHLDSKGIKHVLSRRNNPQTNGKLERHWLEYNRHRWRFETLDKYIEWYNNRLHGSLKLHWAETPNQAFIRKMKPETLIGLMFK